MKLKGLIDTDFVNYKLPSMFIIFPFCDFKCCKENGNNICQNSQLAHDPIIEYDISKLVHRYVTDPTSKAVLCGGLEPLESFDDVLALLETLRKYSQDDFVIYTGFNKSEIEPQLKLLKQYPNVIIKFGRFIPGHNSHYDPVLGVELASDNQYAEKIS